MEIQTIRLGEEQIQADSAIPTFNAYNLNGARAQDHMRILQIPNTYDVELYGSAGILFINLSFQQFFTLKALSKVTGLSVAMLQPTILK
uniref:Plug domain-containing protein n=1 Tax=Syphacia muris TaxID=451379 RepID=A0A0N5A8H0_9BILA